MNDEQDPPESWIGFQGEKWRWRRSRESRRWWRSPRRHGLHPTLVNEWKRQLADVPVLVFEKGTGKAEKDGEALGRRALEANRRAESGTGFFGTQARSLSRAESIR